MQMDSPIETYSSNSAKLGKMVSEFGYLAQGHTRRMHSTASSFNLRPSACLRALIVDPFSCLVKRDLRRGKGRPSLTSKLS